MTITGLNDGESSTNQNYTFDYRERLNAAYIQWSSQWGKQWSTSAGMRIEHANTKADMAGNGRLYDIAQTDAAPSISVAWNSPNGSQSVSATLGRRISRPQYQDLNPYPIWTSDNTFTVGNPDLKTSKSWNIDIYYLFLRDFILNVSYTDGGPNERAVTYGYDGKTFTTRINTGLSRKFATILEYNKVFFSIWRFRAQAYFDWKYDFCDHDQLYMKNISNGLSLNIYNSLLFADRRVPKIEIHIQGGYLGQTLGIGSYPFVNFNLEVSKELIQGLDARIGLSSGLSNLFTRCYADASYSYVRKIRNFPLGASLNISYAFGNKQLREVHTNSEELRNSRF